MVCFEVSHNGVVICTVGNEQGSVDINVMKTSFSKSSDAEINLCEYVHRPASTGDDLAPILRAALQHPERPMSMQPVYWIDRKKLKAGDEITIRLIEVPADPSATIPNEPSGSN